MPPGSEQTVRFVARPPKDLPDGEYWSRIVISSQNANPPEIGEVKEGVISARLNTIIQTAASLKYRRGDLVSKVEITDSWVERKDDIVSVFIDMVNRGNVSYLGVLDVRVLDADGNELVAKDENTAVYYDLRRRVDLQLPVRENRRARFGRDQPVHRGPPGYPLKRCRKGQRGRSHVGGGVKPGVRSGMRPGAKRGEAPMIST